MPYFGARMPGTRRFGARRQASTGCRDRDAIRQGSSTTASRARRLFCRCASPVDDRDRRDGAAGDALGAREGRTILAAKHAGLARDRGDGVWLPATLLGSQQCTGLRKSAASVGGLTTIAHHGRPLPVPIEIRPHVGAALAAGPADKPLFDVGQPEIFGPAIGTDRDRVAAAIVGAVAAAAQAPRCCLAAVKTEEPLVVRAARLGAAVIFIAAGLLPAAAISPLAIRCAGSTAARAG